MNIVPGGIEVSLGEQRARMTEGMDLQGDSLLEPCLELGIGRIEGIAEDADWRAAVFRLKDIKNRSRNASYRADSRRSSMPRMTTASTPGSPSHCGVVSLGKSRPT